MTRLPTSLLVAALALGGCSGFGDFDLTLPLAEQRVQGSLVGGLLGDLFEVPIPLEVDLAAETAARDTGPAQAVRLSALTLSITATDEGGGDSDDFDFIESVDIFAESAMSGSGLPRVRIATLRNTADGGRTLSFDTERSVNLLPYINEGARLTSEASGTVPPDNVSFDGAIVLTIEVL